MFFIKKIVIIFLICMFLAGCATQDSLNIRNIPNDKKPTAEIETTYYFGKNNELDATTPADTCENIGKVAKITFNQNSIVSFITLGMVTRVQTQIYCVD